MEEHDFIFSLEDYLNFLEYPSPTARNWALKRMMAFYPTKVRPHFAKMLQAASGHAKLLLMDEISKQKAVEMAPVLFEILEQEHGMIAARSAYVLGRLGVDEAREVLKKRLNNITPEENLLLPGLLEGLGALGEKAAVMEYYGQEKEQHSKFMAVYAVITQHQPTMEELRQFILELVQLPADKFPASFIFITGMATKVNHIITILAKHGIVAGLTRLRNDLGITPPPILVGDELQKLIDLWKAEEYKLILEILAPAAPTTQGQLTPQEQAQALLGLFKEQRQYITNLSVELQRYFIYLSVALAIRANVSVVCIDDPASLSIPQIMELLQEGNEIENEQDLLDYFAAQPNSYDQALQLLQMVDRPWAQRRAIHILGKIGRPASISVLMGFLDDEFLVKSVINALINIGAPVVDYFKTLFEKGTSRKGLLCSILAQIPTRNSVNLLREHFDELYLRFQQITLSAVMNLGAPEFLEKVQEVYRPGEPFETETLALLLVLHKPEDPRIKELEEELGSDKSKRIIMLHNEEYQHFLVEGPIAVQLLCLACGNSFHHEFDTIYIHPQAARLPLERAVFFPQSVSCKYCEAKDTYTYTAVTLNFISAAIINMTILEEQKKSPQDIWPKTPLRSLDFKNPEGEAGPPQYWILKYTHDLASDPENPVLFHRLGGALRGLSRNEEALDAYSRSLALDQNNLEAYLALSDLLMGMKKPQEAQRFLLRGKELLKKGKCYDSDPSKVRQEYEKRLAQFDQQTPSVNPTSRNAPCSCGSGKKYKHCCGS